MLQYSFIIPVYNCEKYLESCVLSILKQTENYDFEIVLIDDGSLDKGGSIADITMSVLSIKKTAVRQVLGTKGFL